MKQLCIVILSLFFTLVQAEPIRIIMPWPAGGPADVLVRNLQQALAVQGTETVIIYKPGADGQIAMAELLSKPANGSYVMLAGPAQTIINSVTVENYYERFQTTVPVALIAHQTFILVANAKSNIRSFQQLQTEQRKLNVGAFSATAKLFFKQVIADNPNAALVSYPGEAPMLPNLLSGQLDVALLNASATNMQYIANGVLVPLAASQGLGLSNTKSFRELKLDQFTNSFFGIFAPPGTSPVARDNLNRQFTAALSDPTLQDFYQKQYLMRPSSTDPNVFADLLKKQYQQYRQLVP
jgi:tripartite-type tricarboxylate transporter receptor subunit TctC